MAGSAGPIASALPITFYQSTPSGHATLERVTAAAGDGTLDLGALIQEVVPIDEAVGVYDRLRDEPLSVGGTVFDWRSPNVLHKDLVPRPRRWQRSPRLFQS